MKRTVFAIAAVFVLLLVAVRAFGQPAHVDSPKVTVTVTQTLLVGPAILLPGDYKVQCRLIDGKTFLIVTSVENGKEIALFECERETLREKVTETQMHAITVGDGTQRLRAVRIKGELVAHRLLVS